jgi:hypothetical protein
VLLAHACSLCLRPGPDCNRAVFQQLEVDYCLQRPRNDVWPSRAQQVPVVRLFGVNDAGVQGRPLLCVQLATASVGFKSALRLVCVPLWEQSQGQQHRCTLHCTGAVACTQDAA